MSTRTGALVTLALSTLLASLGTSVANVGLPTFSEAFHAPFAAVQWVVLAYLLTITALVVSVGRMGDLLGRRRLLLLGLIVFTLASLASSLAPTLGWLIAARAVQGAGAAAMAALSAALVGDVMPSERLGRVMGILGSMSAVGTALGPSVGGALIGALGWQALFAMNVPLGLIAIVFGFRYLPTDAPQTGGTRLPLDVAGLLLLSGTLGLFAYTATHARTLPSSLIVSLGGIVLLGAWLFVVAERHARAPLLSLRVLQGPIVGPALLANVLVSTVVMSTLVVGPFYLSRTLLLPPAQVGLAMSVGPVMSALVGVPSGRVADRLGAMRAACLGLGAMMIGGVALTLAPSAWGLAAYLVPLAAVTSGYSLFQAANGSALLQASAASDRGVISGLLGVSRNIGLISGAGAMGALFAATVGSHDLASATPAAVATGMHATYAVAAVLIFLAFVFGCGRRLALLVPLTMLLMVAPAALRAQPASMYRDPYPLMAAGWGPPAGKTQFMSRWAEEWGRPTARVTPFFDGRLRFDHTDHARLVRGRMLDQGLFRGSAGLSVRATRQLRLYGEISTGQLSGVRGGVGPNFQNAASLQQLFVDVRGQAGTMLVGTMLGRQEYADGPRQLVSLSDGPNVRRTWNGARAYVHASRWRVGAAALSATQLRAGAFDDGIERREQLLTVTASVRPIPVTRTTSLFIDPYWLRTRQPIAGPRGASDVEVRATYGVRAWGRHNGWSLDWTVARQEGHRGPRPVGAWAAFLNQSHEWTRTAWRPRSTLRLDVASGGGASSSGASAANGRLAEFNPLYTSSAYLSDGQLLGLANLVLVTPGVGLSPSPRVDLLVEYGIAQRLDAHDPIRAGGARSDEATRAVSGRAIGGQLRLSATRRFSPRLSTFVLYEQLRAGAVLRRAGLPTSRYGQAGITLRH